MKRYLLITTFIIGIYPSAFSQSLNELVDSVVAISPELKMLEAKVNVSASRIEQNTNLPDPMLSLGLMNMPVPTFSFTQEPMTMKVVGLSQEIPFPGMLSTKADVNKKDVEIVWQEYYDSRNDLIKKVSQSYFELQYIRKEIELTVQQIRLMKDISTVVNTMYSVSEANQQNVLRIDLELTNMAEMLSALKGEKDELVSTLNAYLLKDPYTQIVADAFPQFVFTDKTLNEFVQLSEQNRPYLLGVNKAIEKAKLNQSAVEYDYYPMFRLSAQYAFRDEIESTGMPLDNMLSVMLDVSIPINYGGKVTAMVEETQSMQQMYEEQYSASLQMLRREFGMITAKLKSLEERIELVEGGSLIQARENLNSSLTAYQVGEIDFMNVLDAQNGLYTIEKNLYRLKTDYLKLIAEVEFLTGTKINEQ